MKNVFADYVRSSYEQDCDSLETCEQGVDPADSVAIELEKHLTRISSQILLTLYNEQLLPKSYQKLSSKRDCLRLQKNALHLAYDTYCILELYERWFTNMQKGGFAIGELPNFTQTREEVIQRMVEIEEVLLGEQK